MALVCEWCGRPCAAIEARRRTGTPAGLSCCPRCSQEGTVHRYQVDPAKIADALGAETPIPLDPKNPVADGLRVRQRRLMLQDLDPDVLADMEEGYSVIAGAARNKLGVAPWEFSAPGSQPNLPSKLGEELGAELARLTEPELSKHSARPCDDCAFVKGTTPNKTAYTLMDAIKCVVEGVPFYCHKGVSDEEDPRRLCAGWSAACGVRTKLAAIVEASKGLVDG